MYSPPIDFFARNEYCLIAKRRGRWVEALQRFKDFSSIYPENFDIKSEIVNILIKLYEYTEAYDFLKSEIKHNPQNQKAWKSIIDCFYLNQNYFEALEFIEKYNSRFGEDEKLFYYKSACLREVGRYDASKEVLERGLNLFPESFDLKMSYAHLYRRLSSEFFFEKDDYNRKALEIHKSAKPLYAYQQRVLNTEIINDLVHLNQYSEALRMIENLLEEKPDHIELYHQNVRVLSKMGNHSESYALIKQLPEELREDIQLKILEANELLALDMWEECNKLLEEILDEENMPDALITQIKLYLRQGAHGKAKNSFKTLFELSPHHAFIYNDLIDFALTNQDMYPDFYEKLGIKHTIGSNDLLQLHANELVETDGMLVMSFKKNVTVSHIVLTKGQSFIEQINISRNGTDFIKLQTIPHKSSLSGQDIIIEGVFDVKSIKLPLDK
ncbi:MAG: hypothetical protein EBS24_08620, partial [Chitinophagia bacterium]|nr:hypothetical protein [Chitinophagia bacterium]